MLLPKPQQGADQDDSQDNERVGAILEEQRNGRCTQKDQDDRTAKLREQRKQGTDVLVWLEPDGRIPPLTLLRLLGAEAISCRPEAAEDFICLYRPKGRILHPKGSPTSHTICRGTERRVGLSGAVIRFVIYAAPHHDPFVYWLRSAINLHL